VYGFTRKFLPKEHAEDRAIDPGRAYARPIGIEDANRVDRQPVHPVPMKRCLFALIFGERVRILRVDRMVFARRNGGEPVAGRRGRINEFLDARLARAFENPHRALDVGVHVLRRLLDRGHDVADAGEMEDAFRIGKDRGVRLELPDILPVAGEIGISLEMIEIAAMTADQIIDDADRKARADQCIDHVAADETGSAGNDRNGLAAAHAALSLFSRRTL
jgi:hypothetical protein